MSRVGDALDGVGLSLWWLGDAPAALDARSRAFALLRREQRDGEAAMVGIWLARQYGGLFHRTAMAEGWLARTRSLVAGMADAGSLEGWLALVDSEASLLEPAIADAERAVATGRQYGDVDLEIVSLARLGACRVATGEVVEGRRDLQQAMTAAMSGEGQDVQYVGEALCTLLEVAGWLGDPGMVEPWAEHLAEFRSAYAFGPLLPLENTSGADLISAFCTSCCGGVYLVTGRLDVAERELVEAVSQLTTTGAGRDACTRWPGSPSCGCSRAASKRRRRYWWASSPSGSAPWSRRPWTSRRDGRSGRRPGSWPRSTASRPRAVLAVPVRVQLVDAALAAGDLALAERTAAELADAALATGTTLHRAQADFAAGKVAAGTRRSRSRDPSPIVRPCVRGVRCPAGGLPGPAGPGQVAGRIATAAWRSPRRAVRCRRSIGWERPPRPTKPHRSSADSASRAAPAPGRRRAQPP